MVIENIKSRLREERGWRLWRLALLPLATGAGLVAYILTRLSLLIGVAVVAFAGILAATIVWRRARSNEREIIKYRASLGFKAGILATVAYDASRYIIINVLHLTFWPFDIFSIFGALLIGAGAPAVLREATGILFHYANGIGFSIAFFFLFPRPGIRFGLLWALVLELFMVSLYPGWLGLAALDEFLSVSILGHFAFGATLGLVARIGLKRKRSAARSASGSNLG